MIPHQAVLRNQLLTLLGDLPPRFTPQARITSTTQTDDCIIEHFTFDNGADVGSTVYGTILIPNGLRERAPAVLYHHVHGGKYEWGRNQLTQPHEGNGICDGLELVKRGFVVLGIDAYGFNNRISAGPAGDKERGRDTEQSLFKHFLWRGSTLWGMIVRDDLLALDYLLTRPEVDPARVGATGMSLGGSRTTWVSALDDRVKVIVPIGQMTRYADFAAAGNYSLHSIYYYVPNALKSGIDMEHLVAIDAPRRQAILIGDSDPLSPLEGVRKIEAFARAAYAQAGAAGALTFTYYAGIGHQYTGDMAREMMRVFEAHL